MIEPGKKQTLHMTGRTEHGIYLSESEDTPDEKVLLPKNQVPEGIGRGDALEVFIYRDSEDRLIATVRTPKIMLGRVALLKVAAVEKAGAFVDWGLEKDLLLPFAEQTKKVSAGEDVLVTLYVDKSGRLCLTMKVYNALACDSPYKKDDRVSGRVYEISERFGAFVAVDDMYSALIPAREVFPDIRVGEVITARVTDVRPDGKLTLSAREKAYIQMDRDAERVMEIIDSFDGVLPFSDSAPPEVIKRETGMSKNAFKRAVGKLYKERKISIEEKAIRRL
ncbi:MAG: S1 RNA-binding domain-containing protein [Lachnospiraceae bacterium]|nr:S1 RNA-binding domain-containing protein [Lachnospiraceae bacterium]